MPPVKKIDHDEDEESSGESSARSSEDTHTTSEETDSENESDKESLAAPAPAAIVQAVQPEYVFYLYISRTDVL